MSASQSDEGRLREALEQALPIMERFTTGDVTGFCEACRTLTIRDGGTTPNVLDGEPHLRKCPIGAWQTMARAALSQAERVR